MTDEFDTAGDVPEAPSAAPPPPSDPVEAKVAEGRDTALRQLAKDESAEAYAREREDQEAFFDLGEKLDERRNSEWFRRASKALREATLQAQGIDVNEQGVQEPQEAPSGYIPANEVEHMLDQERKTAQARMRVDAYFGGNTQRKEEIVNWHQAMDPGSVCAQWVIDSGSPVAGQLMERLADHPEGLQEIAQMTPSQRDRVLGHLEGRILAETQFAQQMAQQNQQWGQPKRISSAPPPINPPKGGASPPTDIYGLAGRAEDVTSYVRARKAMERRRDE
jgi:hypothetical protein